MISSRHATRQQSGASSSRQVLLPPPMTRRPIGGQSDGLLRNHHGRDDDDNAIIVIIILMKPLMISAQSARSLVIVRAIWQARSLEPPVRVRPALLVSCQLARRRRCQWSQATGNPRLPHAKHRTIVAMMLTKMKPLMLMVIMAIKQPIHAQLICKSLGLDARAVAVWRAS